MNSGQKSVPAKRQKASFLFSDSQARRVYEIFRQEVRKRGLIQDKDHVLLAYSGGPDSTALLSLLTHLRQEISFQVSLAHLNHRLRTSALEDEAFVREMAQRFGLPLVVRRRDVRSYARRHRLNLEEAGRLLRYAFLKETAERLGATKIATGHTMDDQAETFLIRLLRGSGPRGLAGISPFLAGKIIRPLLGLRRSQLETYLRSQRLPFRLDESNLDRRYLRNRVRLELIPLLEKKFDRRIVIHLTTAADILREEEEYLSKLEEEAASEVIRRQDKTIFLDLAALSKMPPALSRRLVRRFLAELKGNLREVSFADVERIHQLEPEREIQVRGGLALVRIGSFLLEKKALRDFRNYELLWDGRSPLEIPVLGLCFSGRIVSSREIPPFDDSKLACIDAHRLRFPLLVRSRRPGDRYQPIGARGLKKLKDIMSSRHLSRSLRPFLPVFLSAGQIVWVPGCPVAEAFKVREKSGDVFIIEKIEKEASTDRSLPLDQPKPE